MRMEGYRQSVYRIVGDRVRELRKSRKWSQQQLAMKTGISQTYISDLERVRRTNVSFDYVLRLASAFGVTVDDLMQRMPIQNEEEKT